MYPSTSLEINPDDKFYKLVGDIMKIGTTFTVTFNDPVKGTRFVPPKAPSSGPFKNIVIPNEMTLNDKKYMKKPNEYFMHPIGKCDKLSLVTGGYFGEWDLAIGVFSIQGKPSDSARFEKIKQNFTLLQKIVYWVSSGSVVIRNVHLAEIFLPATGKMPPMGSIDIGSWNIEKGGLATRMIMNYALNLATVQMKWNTRCRTLVHYYPISGISSTNLGDLSCPGRCSVYMTGTSQYSRSVLLHELFHTLGMNHASSGSTRSTFSEYGDGGTVMGDGKIDMRYDLMNAAHVYAAGWMHNAQYINLYDFLINPNMRIKVKRGYSEGVILYVPGIVADSINKSRKPTNVYTDILPIPVYFLSVRKSNSILTNLVIHRWLNLTETMSQLFLSVTSATQKMDIILDCQDIRKQAGCVFGVSEMQEKLNIPQKPYKDVPDILVKIVTPYNEATKEMEIQLSRIIK